MLRFTQPFSICILYMLSLEKNEGSLTVEATGFGLEFALCRRRKKGDIVN
jgi:hypothetical protein